MKYLLILLILTLTSCGTLSTKYKVTDYYNRNYYVNEFKIQNRCITFAEYTRGKLRDSTTICGLYYITTKFIGDRKCKQYIKELRNIGYSKEWATHKALVEHGFISQDEEYLAIEED